MGQDKHRLFKIGDGADTIVFVPTLKRVYRVPRDIAVTLPDFVTASAVDTPQLGSEKLKYVFTEATLILTNRCNLKCVYCFGGYVPRPTEIFIMPMEIIRATVDYLVESAKRSGRQQVGAWMFGGEPTVPWNTLVEAVRYLRTQASQHRLESSVGITTNGYVRLQRAGWLAENMDRILLSIDGPKDIHDAQRSGSFDRVFSAAQEIYQIAPHKLRLRATISAASVQRLPEIVRFFGKNFPSCVQSYEPLFVMGRAKVNPLAQPPKDSLFFEKYIEAMEVAKMLDVHIKTSMTTAWQATGTSFCGAAGGNFTVNYDGRVVSCHRMAEPDVSEAAPLFCYGHFDPLEGRFVFDDERYEFLNERLTVASIPECQDCFAQYSCRGDCPANKAAISPNSFWKEKSYQCEEIREFYKNLLRYALSHGEEGSIF